MIAHNLVDQSELEPLNELANRICRKQKDLPQTPQEFKKFASPQKSNIAQRLKFP